MSRSERELYMRAIRARWHAARVRAPQLRCAFTGRYMRAWVPVTHGPAWALDVDASLAPEVTS